MRTVLQPVLGPVLQPVRNPRGAVSLEAAIRALYAGGAQGAWFDPSDWSTLYQDAAGTTAVTAVGQPVGLILDKSLGASKGAERAVNGSFSADTAWAKAAGVTISGGTANFAAVVAGASKLSQSGSLGGSPASKSYWITYTVSNYSAGSVRFLVGGGAGTYGAIRSANGTYSELVQVGSGVTLDSIEMYVQAQFTGSVDDLSVRELPGNHASQSTTTSRPNETAFGAYNGLLYDGVDDNHTVGASGGGTAGFFWCGCVQVAGGAGTARTLWSDTGTNTGYRVRINASNQLELAAGNGTAYTTAATTGTLSVGTTYVLTAWDDGTNLNVQINQTTSAQATRPAVSAGTASFTMGRDNGASTSAANAGVLSEVYVKNGGLTAAQIAQVQRYAAAKGGVAL